MRNKYMAMGFDKEYIEQFRTMTPEQIENHIGLEKVRNVVEGYPAECGIERIKKLIQKVQKKSE